MRTNNIFGMFAFAALIGTAIWGQWYKIRGHVAQSLADEAGILCGRNDHDECYATYAWVDGKISETWYDNPLTLTDSLKQARKQQAQRLIDLVK